MNLGERIRCARLSLGVTTRDLAEATGISAAQLWRYERGIHFPSQAIARRLGLRLGLRDLDVGLRCRITIDRVRAEALPSPRRFGPRLRLERLRFNWSQEDLARESLIGARAINRIENGGMAAMFSARALTATLGAEEYLGAWCREYISAHPEISALRRKRIWLAETQLEVAERANVSPTTVSNAERRITVSRTSLASINAALAEARAEKPVWLWNTASNAWRIAWGGLWDE